MTNLQVWAEGLKGLDIDRGLSVAKISSSVVRLGTLHASTTSAV